MENENTLGKISAKLIRKLYDENRPIFEIKHAQNIFHILTLFCNEVSN